MRQPSEIALIIAMVGDIEDDNLRSVLSRPDSSVHLSKSFTKINGRRLPAGSRPEIAPDLEAADRDLALRLLNRAADARGGRCTSAVSSWYAATTPGRSTTRLRGKLHPILVDWAAIRAAILGTDLLPPTTVPEPPHAATAPWTPQPSLRLKRWWRRRE